jgi:hypothetical protein
VRFRALLSVDAQEILSRSEVSIVYLASSRDTVVPRWNADEVASDAPSAQLVVIDGAHMTLYTNADAAATLFAASPQTTVPQPLFIHHTRQHCS